MPSISLLPLGYSSSCSSDCFGFQQDYNKNTWLNQNCFSDVVVGIVGVKAIIIVVIITDQRRQLDRASGWKVKKKPATGYLELTQRRMCVMTEHHAALAGVATKKNYKILFNFFIVFFYFYFRFWYDFTYLFIIFLISIFVQLFLPSTPRYQDLLHAIISIWKICICNMEIKLLVRDHYRDRGLVARLSTEIAGEMEIFQLLAAWKTTCHCHLLHLWRQACRFCKKKRKLRPVLRPYNQPIGQFHYEWLCGIILLFLFTNIFSCLIHLQCAASCNSSNRMREVLICAIRRRRIWMHKYNWSQWRRCKWEKNFSTQRIFIGRCYTFPRKNYWYLQRTRTEVALLFMCYLHAILPRTTYAYITQRAPVSVLPTNFAHHFAQQPRVARRPSTVTRNPSPSVRRFLANQLHSCQRFMGWQIGMEIMPQQKIKIKKKEQKSSKVKKEQQPQQIWNIIIEELDSVKLRFATVVLRTNCYLYRRKTSSHSHRDAIALS